MTFPRITIVTRKAGASPELLAKTEQSIANQSFAEWEWCESIEAGTAEHVCFVDAGDTLEPDALAETMCLLKQGFDAVYTDSDLLYKPDWSPEYLRGSMYVGDLLTVRRDLALRIGEVHRDEFLLRYSELTQRIGHVSKLLYHARPREADLELRRRAVGEHLQRLRIPIDPLARENFPRVSVIIPTRDCGDVLENCLRGIYEKTTYPNLEVICMDNETTEAHALNVMQRYPVRHVLWPGKFNYSKVNNQAVRLCGGEFLVFMNNDVEVLQPDWVEQMLYFAEQDGVGAVGALLLYPDMTIQHAGVILGPRGTADHVNRGLPADAEGYGGSVSCSREVSAVTGACFMMRRSTFEEVRGFDEHYFSVYQDVDLCLRVRATGRRNIYTPRARFIHHESVSRGSYYDLIDRALLLDLWEPAILAGDPYFNRNLVIN